MFFLVEGNPLMLFSSTRLIGISGMCIIGLLLLIVDYDAKFEQMYTTNTREANNSSPKHARECIQFYDVLQKGLAARLGSVLYPKSRTSLTLVSAYAYSDYSVVTLEADGWYGQGVYCHYFDANWEKLNLTVESVVFPEFSVHCCRHPEAFYMGITQSKDDDVVFKVPVLDRTVDGVQHLYVYVKDIDDYSRLLIDDYEKSGEIEVVYFKKEQDRLGADWHVVGVVDCLQRSRHHSRYAIFADLDERILAVGNQSLAEYISEAMKSKPSVGMLQFQMAWVIRSRKVPDEYEAGLITSDCATGPMHFLKGESTLKNHLPTLVFHNTSALFPPGHTAKCVIDPRRVIIMDIHEVLLYFPGFEGIRAPPNAAFIRHYRDLYDNFGRSWKASILSRINYSKRFGNFSMTNYPEHLMTELYKNVKDRLSCVYKTT